MVTDADKPREHGPVLSDADRLLLLVRRMHAIEFASVFRQELGTSELMQVITALPTGGLNGLLDRARRSSALESSQPARQDRPLAVEIREARRRAHMSQVELAAALGIRQSSVSQWERAVTEPSSQNLLDLLRVLPGLAETLAAVAARRGRPAGEPAPTGLHG